MADTGEKAAASRLRVGQAAGAVSLLTLVSRLLGLVRDQVTANYLGAGMASDAFFVAFKVPNLLRRLVAEGSLATAFIPVFSDELARSKEAARKAIGAVSSFTLVLTLGLTALGMFYSHEIVSVIAPGWLPSEEKSTLVIQLMRCMFPYVSLVALLALSSSILNSLGYFALPASWPAILNVAMISSLLIVGSAVDKPVYALAFAVIIGGLVSLFPQLRLLRKLGFALHFTSPFRSRVVRKLLFIMIPTVFSSSIYQIMLFVNTSLASLLEEGSVSWLYYADRVFQFPLGIFSLAVATAVLPEMSRLSSRGDSEGLKEQLQLALEWISFVTIPASLGLICLSNEIVSTLFAHGLFAENPSSIPKTALALSAYSIGLWATSAQVILVRCFLAKKNSRLPAIVTSITVFLNILLALSLMGHVAVSSEGGEGGLASFIAALNGKVVLLDMGHVGLALAGSIASFFALLLLWPCLRLVGVFVGPRAFLVSALRALAAGTLMVVVIEFTKGFSLSPPLSLLLAIPTGMAVYLAASLAMGSGPAKFLSAYIVNYYRLRAEK